MKKQFTIGILFGFFIFLAIAAFPPQWNGSQFQSVGGIFSHTNNGNLGTNMTVFDVFAITNGNLVIGSIGKGLQIKTGSNAKMGRAVLAAGVVTVSTTAVTANSHIFISKGLTNASTEMAVSINYENIVAGTSFDIRARRSNMNTATGDLSNIDWMIVEPAP